MKLLLISNSTNAGQAYLDYPKHQIGHFLKQSAVNKVLFIPYAAVTFSYDAYLAKVRQRFDEIGIDVESIHLSDNPIEAIKQAQGVVVGGGNTFALVQKMQETGIMQPIADRVAQGMPYVGWSAGSNIAAPTLCTTNDMPIVALDSFDTLGLIPFQINPHYTDAHPEGHAGETREQRLEEYIAANPTMDVVGLREGCMLLLEENKLSLIGPHSLRHFRFGQAPTEYDVNANISFLLKTNR